MKLLKDPKTRLWHLVHPPQETLSANGFPRKKAIKLAATFMEPDFPDGVLTLKITEYYIGHQMAIILTKERSDKCGS